MCKKALKSVFRPIKKAAAKLEQIGTGGSTNVFGIGEFEPTGPSGPSAADIAKQEADAAAKTVSATVTTTAETIAKKVPVTIDTSGKDVPTTASLSSKPVVKAKPKPKSLIKTGAVDQEQEMMLKSRLGRRQGSRGRRSLLTGFTGAGFYNRFIS